MPVPRRFVPALGALLGSLFLVGCSDFSPKVGPIRDDADSSPVEYGDAGTGTTGPYGSYDRSPGEDAGPSRTAEH